MKSNLFRKIVAGTSALAMIGTVGIVPVSVSAATGTYLSTDFDTYSDGSGNYTWGSNILTTQSNSDLNKSNISFTGNAATIGSSVAGDAGGNRDDFAYDIVTMNSPIGSISQKLDVSFKMAKKYNGEMHSMTLSFNDSDGDTVFGVNYTLTGRNGDRLVQLVTNDAEYNTVALTPYTDNAWTTYDISVNYLSENSGYVAIGDTVVPFNGAAIKSVSLEKTGNTQNRGVVVDDLKIDASEPDKAMHLVKYIVEGEVTYEAVEDGSSPSKAPDTKLDGKIFAGWSDGNNTYTELSQIKVNSDMTLTATYNDDTSYIEPIASAVITGPTEMTMGVDNNTEASNIYTLTLTGEKGTVITSENYDERVKDFKVEWSFNGLKTENDSYLTYCDGYGAFTQSSDKATTADFRLKSVSMNFYGTVSAKVTYNGQTIEAEAIPVIALGNKSKDPNQILPEGGYISDINDYSDDLIGYEMQSSSDPILGGLYYAGSDTKDVVLSSDDSGKFIHIKKNTAKKSSVITHSVNIGDGQAIFEQNLRFNSNGGVVTLTSGYPTWNSDKSYGVAYTLTYNNSKIDLNGTEIKDPVTGAAVTVDPSTWYKVVISADKSTETAWVKVYNPENTCIGEASNVAWTNSGITPSYYSVGLGNAVTGTIDLSSYKVYRPVSSQYNVAAENTTLSIPEDGEDAVSTNITASMQTAEGYEITSAAEWSINDSTIVSTGKVKITPDENDSHKATLTVEAGAAPGQVPVMVAINGETKIVNITLTASKDNVKFTQATSSISIPLDSSKTTKVQYAAVAVNKDDQPLEGKTVTYALYDRNNQNEITQMPAGISFNKTTGELEVASNAVPASYYVRAISTNTEGDEINYAIKITIHGLSFDFGTDAEGAVVEGYTPVTASTMYSQQNEYGVEGVLTAGGEASETDVNADYLEGSNFKFKVNVQAGEVYTVKAVYKGVLYTEATDGITTGHLRNVAGGGTTNTDYTGAGDIATELTEYTFDIPVVDDVLDLNFTGECAIASLSIEKKNRTATEKPVVYAIGDSTLGNAGSYGYVLSNKYTKYTDFANLITRYVNAGKGSRTLINYIEQGWLDSVLASVNPGDVVTIGNMGTNTGGLEGAQFTPYLQHYIDSCIKMGAKVILTSYTPHGNDLGRGYDEYDEETRTFSGVRTDDYDNETYGIRSIYNNMKDDPNILGFVDIGQMAVDAFNAYVADGADDTEKDARAQEILDSFSDHNHYAGKDLSNPNRGGSKVCLLMLDGYGDDIPGIVKSLTDILSGSTDPSEPTTDPTEPTTDPTEPTTDPTEPTTDPTEPTTDPTEPTTDPTEPTTDPSEPTTNPITGVEMTYKDGTVTITSDKAQNAVLVYASYTDGRLTGVNTETVAIEANAPFTKAMAANNGDKFMLWDSIEGMNPITDVVTVEGVEVVETANPTTDPAEPTTDPSEPTEPEATVNPDAEAKMIWKASADNNGAAADTELADGLSIMFDATYSDFTISADDPTTETRVIDGVLFTGYISHPSMTGSWSGTTVDPAKSTVIKYTASANGVATFYLSNVGDTKKVCIGQDGMSKGDIEAAGIQGTGDDMVVPVNVKADETYYVYVAGSKGRFCGVAFEEGASVEDPEPQPTSEPSIPEPQENVWEMTSVYQGCPAGTELMIGLTTLFTDTGNGKYLSSGDNGSFDEGVATGTALKYEAQSNGTLSVSFIDLGTPSSDGSPKTIYMVEEGGKQDEPVAIVANESETEKLNGTIEGKVEAGKAYYIYGRGTKARFTAASFTAE